MKETIFRYTIVCLIFMCSLTLLYSRSFEEVIASKIIKIGISDESVPFHFLNESGDYIGFDIDLATIISRKFQQDFGVETEWIPGMYPSNKENHIEDDVVDIVISAYSIIDSRKKRVTFSIPYFVHDGLGMIVKAEFNPLKYDLNNFPFDAVCFQGSSTGAKFVFANINDKKFIPVATPWDGIKRVVSGEVPCFIADYPTLQAYCNKMDQIKLVFSPFNIDGNKDFFGIGMKKNDYKMKIYLDKLIRECKRHGILRDMERKWLGNE